VPAAPHRPTNRDAQQRRERRRAFRDARVSAAEVARYLRTEQVGGLVLVAATVAALIAANSPAQRLYHQLADWAVGPTGLHLHLSLHAWATDGLLSLFFLIAGLELKKELVVGELRHPRTAMLPILSAVGGMVIPALVFLAVTVGTPGAGRGWAIPIATDIAFALAVLAIAARELPPSLRVFLLTLAIVDDLGAIVLIAVLFTSSIALLPLLGSLLAVAGWAVAQRLRITSWWVYLLLGLAAWGCLHASGIHATVAGVLLGFATRVRRDDGEALAPAELWQHRLQPWSAGVAVPAFAFFAAGVTITRAGFAGFTADRLALGVIAGLVIGKAVGVLGAAALAVRLRLAQLPAGLSWRDLAAVSVLTGCGFTVSLLITTLSFHRSEAARLTVAVLVASVAAAGMAALLLRRRVRQRT